jgi:hypothetical protein
MRSDISKLLIAPLFLATTSLQAQDNPEPGRQGEQIEGDKPGTVLAKPYSKGVRVIGHDPIANRGGNLIMAWSGKCAYVADGMAIKPDGQLAPTVIKPTSGIAILDVSKPQAPKTVGYLADKGSLNAAETIHAGGTAKRPILAASNYGGVEGFSAPKEGWLSLYDVSNCTKPKLLSDTQWPAPVHTVRVSPSGRFVYGPVLNPFTGAGGIAVMDIADPAKPKFVGRFGVTRADGTSYDFAPHELVFSPDETRIYVGAVSSKGGDLNAHFKATKPGLPSAESVGQDAGGFYVLDNSDFAYGRPDPKFRLIGTAQKAGWHSPALARINGKRMVVNAGELGACPGAWPRITDISDEANPKVVGEFKLAMNEVENCPPRSDLEKATGGLVGRAGTATTHFNDVDDAENTKLGLFPFLSAGLRVADLRNPENPVEIGYFKPGDPCGSHVRYVKNTRHIWFACNSSGFWVIALNKNGRK